MAAFGSLRAVAALALAVGAAAQFPCGSVPPCEDDSDFLLFDIFPCGTVSPNPCETAEGAAACSLSCLTCAICPDPDPIPGIPVIFQYDFIQGDVIVYMDNTVVVAGFQAQVGCTIGGEYRALETRARVAYREKQRQESSHVQE